jgi:hypothetical protein
MCGGGAFGFGGTNALTPLTNMSYGFPLLPYRGSVLGNV